MKLITNYNVNLLYVFMCAVGWDKNYDEFPEKSFLYNNFIVPETLKIELLRFGKEIEQFNSGWEVEGDFYLWAY